MFVKAANTRAQNGLVNVRNVMAGILLLKML